MMRAMIRRGWTLTEQESSSGMWRAVQAREECRVHHMWRSLTTAARTVRRPTSAIQLFLPSERVCTELK
eukprot:195287-Pleurochrysis_carterae.AAC.1